MKMVSAALLLTAGLLTASCNVDSGPTDQERIAENDRSIQKFLTDNDITTQKTATGLYYRLLTERPDSAKAVPGQFVTISYVASLLSGLTFDSSRAGQPTTFSFGAGTVPLGVTEGISLMRKGERIDLFMHSYLAYWNQSSALVPAYAPVRYDMTLLNVRSESRLLADYVRDSSLTATRLSSGVYYVVIDSGSGDRPLTGQRVEVKYEGRRLLNDCVFDASNSFDFRLGSSVIPGFSQGVSLMRPGGRALVIIPAGEAYGTEGAGNRAARCRPLPNDPLIFDITLLDVI